MFQGFANFYSYKIHKKNSRQDYYVCFKVYCNFFGLNRHRINSKLNDIKIKHV